MPALGGSISMCEYRKDSGKTLCSESKKKPDYQTFTDGSPYPDSKGITHNFGVGKILGVSIDDSTYCINVGLGVGVPFYSQSTDTGAIDWSK